MDVEFSAELWFWRGPSPYHFLTVPADDCAELAAVAKSVSYGWGMIPVMAQIGDTKWTTSLFPKNGGYLLPVKDAIRYAEALDVGDQVTARIFVDV